MLIAEALHTLPEDQERRLEAIAPINGYAIFQHRASIDLINATGVASPSHKSMNTLPQVTSQ